MKQYLQDKYILVGGSAQPPQGTGIHEMYHVMSISFLVQKETHQIEDAYFNVISPLTQQYLKDLVLDYSLLEPVEPLLETIRSHALLTASNAIIQAIRCAFTRYHDFLNGEND